ncbi:MAG: SDR family oxidoreductase [Deltaproteobacteria bacterium]|nr:SDR family oxidoreductase [Deltaproteobacteria bacterium]
MNNNKNKKVVAITGGSRGIGRAIAELFSAKGFSVAVCSRSPRETTLSSDIFHMQVDVRKKEEQNRFVAETVERFGGLHAYVNCAGASRWREIEKIDEAFVAEIIETSLLGTLWGCAAAASVLSKEGVIVNVSSLAGKRGSANNSAYCAAKFAVNGITQSLAKELGPRGIRVNAVCPVYVETPYILNSLEEKSSPAGGKSVREYLDLFAKTQTALHRLPTEEEVAEVVFFLASSQASAITGQCINVDCGVLPQ